MMWPLTSEQLAGMIRDAMWRDPEYLKTIQYLKRAHVTWQPRPDRVDDGDLQTSAWESKADGVCIILGGNGSGTTETAVAKACKSILDTPAPRPDTPFWFLANSLEMSMGVIWKEKIWGHGHIPVEMIDHERISWHKGKQNWPYRVPLKPDKDGNNWELVFRSYEQGRAALQAESIGGFLFSEQFPWSLLEEVVRGCRESGHSNPGTQYVEFTPVDPALSIEIEEMLENGHEPEEGADPDRYYLPEGWEIFTLNTRCAMEAGHVSKKWFEQFFAMVSKELLETRMKGLFPDYKGLIYNVHPRSYVEDDFVWDFLVRQAVKMYRCIDWGQGPENDFVVLWVAENSIGQHLVFKEYMSTEPIAHYRHLKNAADMMRWPAKNELYGSCYADPSGIDGIRSAAELSQLLPGYDDWSMIPAYNAVAHGIDTVRWYLQPELPTLVDGQVVNMPRLFISRRCPKLIRQMKSYRYEDGPEITSRNPRDARPEPLKKNDHGPDALRYLLATKAKKLKLGPAFSDISHSPRFSDQVVPLYREEKPEITPPLDEEVQTPSRFGVKLDRKNKR